MGMLAGVPDLAFILPGGRTAFIELKTAHNKVTGVQKQYLRPEQKAFRARATELGALYAVCRSLEEVQGTLKAWGIFGKAAA